LGIAPTPQSPSPIPNPQSPLNYKDKFFIFFKTYKNKEIKIKINNSI